MIEGNPKAATAAAELLLLMNSLREIVLFFMAFPLGLRERLYDNAFRQKSGNRLIPQRNREAPSWRNGAVFSKLENLISPETIKKEEHE
jgi:hypothetical protein